MAYFKKDDENNIWYSYYGVNDCIPAKQANLDGLEEYLYDDDFQDLVTCSFKSIDRYGCSERDADRVRAKMDRTGDWLRKKMAQNKFD